MDKKRCKKGTRKNKQGVCEPTKQVNKKRCKKGTRKNKQGVCEPTNKMEPVKSSVKYNIVQYIHMLHNEVYPNNWYEWKNMVSREGYKQNYINAFIVELKKIDDDIIHIWFARLSGEENMDAFKKYIGRGVSFDNIVHKRMFLAFTFTLEAGNKNYMDVINKL